MKAQIHPQYFDSARIVCACGTVYNVGSTREEIHVQFCAACHPFFTGQQKFVDTASLIDKFEKRRKEAKPLRVKAGKGDREDNSPKTLKEMLMAIKKQQ